MLDLAEHDPTEQRSRKDLMEQRSGKDPTEPPSRMRTRRGLRVAAAVAILPAALAACGGASTSSNTSKPEPVARVKQAPKSQAAFVACMRTHGLPAFPSAADGPEGVGMAISVTPGSGTIAVDGVSFKRATFNVAAHACRLQP
jgi:hypothetical protein